MRDSYCPFKAICLSKNRLLLVILALFMMLPGSSARATTGFDWTGASGTYATRANVTVTYGSGLFVAVYASYAETSTDGITWTQTYS